MIGGLSNEWKSMWNNTEAQKLGTTRNQPTFEQFQDVKWSKQGDLWWEHKVKRGLKIDNIPENNVELEIRHVECRQTVSSQYKNAIGLEKNNLWHKILIENHRLGKEHAVLMGLIT